MLQKNYCSPEKIGHYYTILGMNQYLVNSIAHFLQRLCWQGKMTTGLVNILQADGANELFLQVLH